MAWEVFKSDRMSSDTPAVTISGLGRIAFNKAAAEVMHKTGLTRAELLWDKDKLRMGVKPTKSTERTSPLNYGDNFTALAFSCIQFLRHTGYDFHTSRQFPATWDSKDHLFVIEIPAEFIKQLEPDNKPKRRAL